jgi:hypothetical protein
LHFYPKFSPNTLNQPEGIAWFWHFPEQMSDKYAMILSPAQYQMEPVSVSHFFGSSPKT